MSQHHLPPDDIKIKEVKELLPPNRTFYDCLLRLGLPNLVIKRDHEVSVWFHDHDNRLLVIIGLILDSRY